MGQVLGMQMLPVKVKLTAPEIEKRRDELELLDSQQRHIEKSYRAFFEYAQPIIKKAFHPKRDEDIDERADVSHKDLEEARALDFELELRRARRNSARADIKARRRQLRVEAGLGEAWEVLECRVEEDDTGAPLQVRIVRPDTEEVVDRRAMTEAERQISLNGVDPEAAASVH